MTKQEVNEFRRAFNIEFKEFIDGKRKAEPRTGTATISLTVNVGGHELSTRDFDFTAVHIDVLEYLRAELELRDDEAKHLAVATVQTEPFEYKSKVYSIEQIEQDGNVSAIVIKLGNKPITNRKKYAEILTAYYTAKMPPVVKGEEE